MATVSKKLGSKIKQLREQKDITQEELAVKARMDYSYLNLIENGKRNPSLKMIAKIARALGVSLKDLLP